MAKKKRPSRPPAAPAKKRGRGRPSVFENPEIEQRFLEALEHGSPLKDALAHAPIDDATYHARLAKDPELAERVRRAKVKARIGCAKIVTNAALGVPKKGGRGWEQRPDVETAKWLLERSDPENFGRKQTVGIKNADPNQPFRVSSRIATMTDEQVDRELAAVMPGGEAEEP